MLFLEGHKVLCSFMKAIHRTVDEQILIFHILKAAV